MKDTRDSCIVRCVHVCVSTTDLLYTNSETNIAAELASPLVLLLCKTRVLNSSVALFPTG